MYVNPGDMVEFRNIEHTYEIFKLICNYWGSWNACPTSEKMYIAAKNLEENFGAEIIDLGYDTIDFRLNRKLSDKEIDLLVNEIKIINAEPDYTGGFEELRACIKEKSEFSLWWD